MSGGLELGAGTQGAHERGAGIPGCAALPLVCSPGAARVCAVPLGDSRGPAPPLPPGRFSTWVGAQLHSAPATHGVGSALAQSRPKDGRPLRSMPIAGGAAWEPRAGRDHLHLLSSCTWGAFLTGQPLRPLWALRTVLSTRTWGSRLPPIAFEAPITLEARETVLSRLAFLSLDTPIAGSTLHASRARVARRTC